MKISTLRNNNLDEKDKTISDIIKMFANNSNIYTDYDKDANENDGELMNEFQALLEDLLNR